MAHFKVVITDFTRPNTDPEENVFRTSGLDIELVRLDTSDTAELAAGTADADALLVQFAKITPEIIEGLQKCQVISRYGIGVDMIDLEAAGEQGIPVCNVPDFCLEEVSAHTIAFLLSLNRHIPFHDKSLHAGEWFCDQWGPPSRLPGQVLGIVGLGNIGQAVASKARCLGLRLLAYDPYVAADIASALDAELVGLEELLRRSDYVSLHCPLTEETHHLIGQSQLALMKPSAFLINMARGAVVDQAALSQALNTGVIKAAALDVFEEEPLPPDAPIRQLDNVMLTPHMSAWSEESSAQLRHDAAETVVYVLSGNPPRWVVNSEYLPREQI